MSDELTAYKIIQNAYNKLRSEQITLNLLRSPPEVLSAPVAEEIYCERVAGSPSYRETRESLDDFVSALMAEAKNAPGPVYIEFENEYGYDGDFDVYLKLICEREPTPEEIDERKNRNAERERLKAAAESTKAAEELAEYERLRAKFAS